MRKSTVEMAEFIDNAKSWKELDDVFKKYLSRKTFGDYLIELCLKYNKKPSELQKEVSISKSLFYDALRDVRNPGKETVIKIGLTLGVEIDELNLLLKLAHHKELYPQEREDSVIMFGLKNKKSIHEINEILEFYGSKIRLNERDDRK